MILGGAFSSKREDNPFSKDFGKGVYEGMDLKDHWVVSEKKHIYDEIFGQLSPVAGKIRGGEAKKVRSHGVCFLKRFDLLRF